MFVYFSDIASRNLMLRGRNAHIANIRDYENSNACKIKRQINRMRVNRLLLRHRSLILREGNLGLYIKGRWRKYSRCQHQRL